MTSSDVCKCGGAERRKKCDEIQVSITTCEDTVRTCKELHTIRPLRFDRQKVSAGRKDARRPLFEGCQRQSVPLFTIPLEMMMITDVPGPNSSRDEATATKIMPVFAGVISTSRTSPQKTGMNPCTL